jgi:hypothetical protein
MDQMDLTGYTQDEIEHMQRVEQKQALHEELHWIVDGLKGEAKKVMLMAMQRIAFLTHQGDAFETRAVNLKAIAESEAAEGDEYKRQRDMVLDELSEYINAVRAGDHPDVRAHIDQAYQDAFEEYVLNGGRLVALVAKLQIPGASET